MKSILFTYLAVALLSSCGNNEKAFETESYEEHKESLQEREKKNPLQFLHVSGDDKKNLIGQTVIKGTIQNKATVVSYRDVRIKMLCYKNTRMVEEHEDVIPDILKPNTKKDFKSRYRLPKGTDSIALSVMSAAVAEDVK